jgi:hypothetical protein
MDLYRILQLFLGLQLPVVVRELLPDLRLRRLRLGIQFRKSLLRLQVDQLTAKILHPFCTSDRTSFTRLLQIPLRLLGRLHGESLGDPEVLALEDLSRRDPETTVLVAQVAKSAEDLDAKCHIHVLVMVSVVAYETDRQTPQLDVAAAA